MVDSMSSEQENGGISAFLLSRAELQAILTLADISIFPGFSPEDPMGELTPEQEAYGIICGERALRARGLAFINDEGELRIQNELLEAIGVCAYALNMLVVTHLSTEQSVGRQYIVFHLDEHYVSQFQPDDVLYLFTIYEQRMLVAEEICRPCPAVTRGSAESFTLSESLLTQLREELADGASKAERLLQQNGVEEPLGRAFLSFLQKPHELIILQSAQRLDADSLELQTTSVLYDESALWIVNEQDVVAKDQEKQFVIFQASASIAAKLIYEMHW